MSNSGEVTTGSLLHEVTQSSHVIGRLFSTIHQIEGDVLRVRDGGRRMVAFVDYVDLFNYLKLDASQLPTPDAVSRLAGKEWLDAVYNYVLVRLFSDPPVQLSLMPWYYEEYRQHIGRELMGVGVDPSVAAQQVQSQASWLREELARQLAGDMVPRLLRELTVNLSEPIGAETRSRIKSMSQECIDVLSRLRERIDKRNRLVWSIMRFEGLRALGHLGTLREALGDGVGLAYTDDDVYAAALARLDEVRPRRAAANQADARAMACICQFNSIREITGRFGVLFSTAPSLQLAAESLESTPIGTTTPNTWVRDAYYWGIWFTCSAGGRELLPTDEAVRVFREAIAPPLNQLRTHGLQISRMLDSHRVRMHADKPIRHWLAGARDTLATAQEALHELVKPFLEDSLEVARVRDSMIGVPQLTDETNRVALPLRELHDLLKRLLEATQPPDLAAVAARLRDLIERLVSLFQETDERTSRVAASLALWPSFGWTVADPSVSPAARELIEQLERHRWLTVEQVRKALRSASELTPSEHVMVRAYALIVEAQLDLARLELEKLEGVAGVSPQALLAQVVLAERSYDWPSVEALLSRLSTLLPSDPVVSMHRVYLAYSLWRISESRELFDRFAAEVSLAKRGLPLESRTGIEHVVIDLLHATAVLETGAPLSDDRAKLRQRLSELAAASGEHFEARFTRDRAAELLIRLSGERR